MNRFFWKIVICVVPLLVSAWIVGKAFYEYDQGKGGFKLGVDLVGGTILIYEVDVNKVKAQLERSLGQLKTGHDKPGALGEEILDAIREAWVFGSLEQGAHKVRTGYLLAAILGSAIAQGEVRSILAVALVAVAFVHKIGIEETFLTQEFGDAYIRYRREVPALIPFVRPR